MLEELKLDSIKLLTIINRVPLFKLLSEQDKRDFIKCQPELYIARAGEAISQSESFDKAFYILLTGAAKSICRKSKNAKVETTLKAGDFIGEVSFCTNEQSDCDVTALRDSVLIKVNQNAMLYLPLIVKDKIKNNIIKELVVNIAAIREQNVRLLNNAELANPEFAELKAEVAELRRFVSKMNQEYPHIKRRYELFGMLA